MIRSKDLVANNIITHLILIPFGHEEVVQSPKIKIFSNSTSKNWEKQTYHPTFLARACDIYVQNVYAPVLSGYRFRKVSTKPVAKNSVMPSRSSLVNPALFVLVLGLAKSISLCATFMSPQIITGFLESSSLMKDPNISFHLRRLGRVTRPRPIIIYKK